MFGRASSLMMTLGQTEDAQAVGGAAGMLMQAAPILMMVLVIYVVMLRPANKQKREHAAFLDGLTRDAEVLTSSGMYAKIVELDARVATVEVADKVRLRILRSCIQGAWAPAAAPSSSAATATAPTASR